MIKKIILVLIVFGIFTKANANYKKLAYDFTFNGIDGNAINLKEHENKVIVVVNVASRCGFTYQYEGLQNLWDRYKNKGLLVLAIPSNNFRQEPGSNEEIKDFCETNFGINFPITEKANVVGSDAHPFFIWAKNMYGNSAIPKWNFHKIVIGKDGKIAETFSSITKPTSAKFLNFIENQIKN